ncbi:alkane 1-monooxygenase, partial [Ahrensia sp. R2A130]|uniref:alkane 1-monooxygenase n=1 Tax=Ahrensia sp. R2A130 TaxID=744979 RepID=UPI0001E083FA
MIFVAETNEAGRVEYRDTKRYLWWLGFTVPVMPIVAILLYYGLGEAAWVTLLPVLYSYVFIPLLDLVMGEDHANPPAEVVEKMAEDSYYRALLLLIVPAFWVMLIASAWFVVTADLPWWSYLAMTVACGMASGTALTVGHELGHKQGRLDRMFAMFANALSGYGHFCIEHNKGHHTWVATPEDPASARFNESIYAFAGRELPGTLKRGLHHERERLTRKGFSFWSTKNEVLQGYAITLGVWIALTLWLGLAVLPFIILQSIIGWFQLTQANYVEHYGLKRSKKENGRYQPVEPRHSWNTNHIVSNLVLFHLQRHSDHHANPMRPYQALRNFDELPRLPSGYPGCFALASIPPLWFKVMNPKVMDWA